MKLIDIQHLNKKYPSFELKDVSFSLESGYIMGFIGKNGAGKTTTMKSMLHLVHPDSGKIFLNGMDMDQNELEIKQSVGIVFGGIDYYPETKIKKLKNTIRPFYKEWNEELFQKMINHFEIDENKKVKELSAGMKVKIAVAMQMAHNARLLILDEPTSGLDPASRDDLILLFQKYIEDGEHSILFSTHITSDLEKCADYITYIKDGRIINSTDKETFESNYLIVNGKKEDLSPELKDKIIGLNIHSLGFEGMINAQDKTLFSGCTIEAASLEDVMVHQERKSLSEVF
jgi:ABC-2 type transport system ATP-binding protein